MKNDKSRVLLGLGNVYEFGRGVKKDFFLVKKYYELSAKLNNSDAFLNLGICIQMVKVSRKII